LVIEAFFAGSLKPHWSHEPEASNSCTQVEGELLKLMDKAA
jgi:hypothetical protein